MTQTASIDAVSILESSRPDTASVQQVRDALCADDGTRRQVAKLIASLPSDVAAAAGDAGLALKKGLALWAIGREREATDWLAHSKEDVAKTYRARAFVATGRPAAALEVAGDAGDAMICGEAHANLGDGASAAKYVKAVDKTGDKAGAAYLAGRVADLDGEHGEAAGHYEAALAIQSEHAPSLFRLALHATYYGDEDEAVEFYRRCIDTTCPPVNAYLNLGNLYEDRGEYSSARKCYESVLAADATNPRARLFAADAMASLNMFYDEDMERRADRRSQVMRLPVTDFELSVRSRNCLAKMGVRTLGDLIQRTEAELLSYKNFGETSLQEIKDILAQKGLRLGMGREEVAEDAKARSILEGIGVSEADRQKVMDKPLSELELSVRSRHCMNVLGLKTVGDLVNKGETELMTIKNFGQTSLNEVKQKLAEMGVTLAGK